MASALRVQVSPSAFFLQKLTSHNPGLSKKPSLVVLIITNGPGELSTWVKPVAERLHKKLSMQPKNLEANISLRLLLVPCPNATGQEMEVAKKMKQFELITPAKSFWKILLNPNKFGYWPSKGIVVFLGGDQFWSVLISARLRYRHITYAEWIARWPQWNDRISAMSEKVRNRIPKKYRQRCKVVGDLMADINQSTIKEKNLAKGKWIAIMPGSKRAKLSIGVPFLLEVTDRLKKLEPEYNFLLPIAPTTSIQEIEYLNSELNPIAKKYKSKIAMILHAQENELASRLITEKGAQIHLIENHPAHDFLRQCDLAITTVGANTAELGALNIPMIVFVPTQHLHVMQAWDGWVGILTRIPIMKWLFKLLITTWKVKNHKYLAWPNISSGRMIVPERIGKITPEDIAQEAKYWLSSNERLEQQKENLRRLRGKPGAIKAFSQEIINLIPNKFT